MTLAESLNHLYERYKMERTNSSNLTIEMFEQLIRIFPAILIAQADGHVDTTEIIHLNKLAHYVSTKEANIAESDLKQEIRYLTWNAHTWRKPILSVLKQYQEEKNCGAEIVDLMISIASSSTGSLISNILLATTNPNMSQDDESFGTDTTTTYISDEEKKEIMLIARELNLLTDEANDKLKFILDSAPKS